MRVKWTRGIDGIGGSLRIKKKDKKDKDEISLPGECPDGKNDVFQARSSSTLPSKCRQPDPEITGTKPKKDLGFFQQLFFRKKRSKSIDSETLTITKGHRQYHTSLLGKDHLHVLSEEDTDERLLQKVATERPRTWCPTDTLAFIDDDETEDSNDNKRPVTQQTSDGDSALGDDVSAESPATVVNSPEEPCGVSEEFVERPSRVVQLQAKPIGSLSDVIQTQTSKSTSSTPHATPTARLRPTQLLGKVDELSKEVQRLGALCEARTKELNMVRMQTKHTALGFDAFGVLVKYLVGELDAFSHPELVADIHKTKEQLITLETVLKQYEADVESMKKVHSEQLDLIAAQLAHSEEEVLKVSNALTDANVQHMKQVRNLSEQHDRDSKEIQQRHDLSMDRITITHQKQLDDTQIEHSQRLEQVVESHDFEKSELQMKLDSLQQRYQTLEAQTRSFEEALNKDTDSKIQWISAKNSELQKEVDSLKSVLDMKQTEIHELRNENMKMKKQLDELPMERHRVKKLQARNEELQALVREKVKTEKKLSFDHRNLKELVEQEEKLKQQLSMENEELQWKLKNSLDCSSMTNISIEGNTISMMATPELAAKVRNFRMMSSAPLSPFHEAAEDQMSRSLPNFSDESQPSCIVSNNSIVGKLSYTKPKPKRPSKSCSASPHKSLCHPHSSSTPAAHSIRKPLDLTTHHHHHPELDETLDISRGSSRSLDSPRSIAELHFKACLQIDAMEEMAVMTGSGLDAETRNILLRSPDVMSSDSGGAGGCSSLASSSVAEDGMSASVSSVEPDDKELGALTPDPDFIQGVYSPRNEAGEAMVNELPQSPGGSSNPHAKHHHRRHFQEDLVTYSNPAANGDHPTTATTTTSLTTSSYDNCFCDDFEYNSEPE